MEDLVRESTHHRDKDTKPFPGVFISGPGFPLQVIESWWELCDGDVGVNGVDFSFLQGSVAGAIHCATQATFGTFSVPQALPQQKASGWNLPSGSLQFNPLVQLGFCKRHQHSCLSNILTRYKEEAFKKLAPATKRRNWQRWEKSTP